MAHVAYADQPSRACPKLLMFDGVNIRTQTTPEQARYWGRTVGIQGFFVNRLMGDWRNDVGRDSFNPLWVLAKRFQTLYGRQGVSDNYMKVAIWKRHDWHDEEPNRQIVQNFGHAAELAKYADLKGLALDLEPYVPIWAGEAGGLELSGSVYRTATAIGKAMHNADPEMTLILLQ
ncbi:MAG: hypothetical protein PVI37_09340, partial [Gammaproteobacteria bacterium]